MESNEIRDEISEAVNFLYEYIEDGYDFENTIDALWEAVDKINKLDEIESDPWRTFISDEIPYQIESYYQQDPEFDNCTFSKLNEKQQQEVINDLINYYSNNRDCVIDYNSFLSDITEIADNFSEEMLNGESDLGFEAKDNEFSRQAYEIYKTEWLEDHVSETLYQETKQEWEEIVAEYGDCPFEEYLSEQGFGGMLYVCFDEFCDNELIEKEEYYRETLSPEPASLDAEAKDMSAAKDAQEPPAAGHDKDKGVI